MQNTPGKKMSVRSSTSIKCLKSLIDGTFRKMFYCKKKERCRSAPETKIFEIYKTILIHMRRTENLNVKKVLSPSGTYLSYAYFTASKNDLSSVRSLINID